MKKHLHYTLVLLLFILIGGGNCLGQTVSYETGFNTNEGFTTNNNYNNSTEKTKGPENFEWKVLCGDCQTSTKLEGDASLHLRYYTSVGKTPYAFTDFSTNNVSNVSFSVQGMEEGNISVQHSTDNGATWTTGQTFPVTTSTSTIEYVVSETSANNVRIKISSLITTHKKGIYIDDFKIYGSSNIKTSTVTFGADTDNQTFTIKEGEESAFTAPKATLTPEEAGTITYSSSDTDVASVDATTGDVTFGSVFGTTTITAKYEGNETYTASEAQYTIKYKSSTEPIFYESFDNNNKEGGNDEKWSAIQTTGDITTDVSGWKFTQGNAASQCARFGTSSNPGSATTPNISGLSGNATLTFKAGAWDNKNEKTTLTLSIANGGEIDKNTVELVKGQWTTYTINITNGTPTTQITFEGNEKGNRFFLDEVTILPYKAPETITLDETKENTITAAGNVTVSLVRTLDNSDWNTFCVPFDISEEQVKAVFGEGTKITEFTSADNTNKMMMFTEATSIKAGTPYLVMPGNETVANPTFEGVTVIEGEPQAVTYGDYAFVGVYSPYAMKTDKTELFVGANGTLSTPAEGKNSMKGMRAFIRLSSADVMLKSISIDGNGTTGISITESEKTADGNVYDLNGRLVGKDTKSLKKGIYIMNGKKIIK